LDSKWGTNDDKDSPRLFDRPGNPGYRVRLAAGGLGPDRAAANPEVVKWAYMAAAIAAGLGVLGAGIAVMAVGAAAMGAISEKPELFARALIFVGLAEGLAIYGLIVAIMILGRV
jgi:V/A-type H+-transporting ATPase subunit K